MNRPHTYSPSYSLSCFLCWDEQNRLQGVMDEKYLSIYQYDANGDRTYKLTGEYTSQNVNGQWRYFYQLDNPTLYASPYMVVTSRGYTKHYYAESERVASKLGNGGLYDIGRSLADETQVLEKFEENTGHFQNVIYECLKTNESRTYPALSYLYKLTGTSQEPERECYWYHPDHLGSSSWITYTDGEAIQHLHYLPWGEDMVNQQLTGFGSMYTFSAKEKDEETGYSYFGSRYYSSDLSIWLSVDPMADKYPSLSPYTYCADNPVKLVDPNGKEVYVNGEAAEESTLQLQATSKYLIITRNEETGKLSVEGKPKGRNDRLLYRAIKSERVKVHIDAEYANKNGAYDIGGDPAVGSNGGSFMGNIIVIPANAKKYVVTSQTVFPEALCEDFDYNGKYYGESIRHEITESFIGGLISLRRNKPAPVAFFDKKIYNIAHNRATPQPVEETSTYESKETITPGYKPYERIYY